jgi:hypothetical protein
VCFAVPSASAIRRVTAHTLSMCVKSWLPSIAGSVCEANTHTRCYVREDILWVDGVWL